MRARVAVKREQVLGYRRRVQGLEERRSRNASSMRRVAWAGLQDSMPRAAVLSLHARVAGIECGDWAHSSLVQVWGPRFNVYVVAQKDLAVFTLGRLPERGRGRVRAEELARRLAARLGDSQMGMAEAGDALGVPHNALRYAAATGTLLIKWEGARHPLIWPVARPEMEEEEARLELVRRYLHVFGPATEELFAEWAGVPDANARVRFQKLKNELVPVTLGAREAWLLAEDEAELLADSEGGKSVRLLPSGDSYYLLWGVDRELLLPEAKRRAQLWTTRVWPGAVLVGGEIVGVWRRAAHTVSIEAWRRFSRPEREAIEREAESLPLPGLGRAIEIDWS